jgi:hypothetical protein
MKATTSAFFISALVGCGGRQESTQYSSTPNACTAPNCCAPIALSASNVRLYHDGGAMNLALTIERLDAASATSRWSPSVIVATASGETMQCDSATDLPPTARYVKVYCSPPSSFNLLACNATVELQIRIRSSTAVATDAGGICDGSGLGVSLSYTVPFECPECPGAVLTGTSCDLPMSCTDGWRMPCYCSFNSTTGKGTWSCAIA